MFRPRPRPRNPYRLPVSIAAALVALALTMAPLPAAAQVLSLETRPDLSISLSASPNPVAPGGSVAFSMLVRNQLSTVNGTPNRTVKGIGVAYALPAGFVVQSLTADRGFTCSNATGSVTCTGGVLDPGQVGRITVNVKAARNAGTFAGTAVVDPLKTIDERNERNNAATASVVVPRADLSLVIRPTRSTVGDGEAFEYRVHVSNADGGVDATGASLRLTLPPGTTFVRAADGYLGWDFRTRHAVGFVCLHAALVVTCTGGSIAAGETGSATVYVAAPRTNGVVTSTARVDASNTIPERDETNNSAAATVTVVGRPDLTASVDHQMPAPLWLNRVVKIRNEGVTAATNVQVHVDARSYESRDLLVGISADSGLTCSAVAWATVPGGHRVTCRGGSIPAGGSARITVINTLWPAPGRRPTDVTADPRSAIEEYDEHNNTAQGGTFL